MSQFEFLMVDNQVHLLKAMDRAIDALDDNRQAEKFDNIRQIIYERTLGAAE